MLQLELLEKNTRIEMKNNKPFELVLAIFICSICCLENLALSDSLPSKDIPVEQFSIRAIDSIPKIALCIESESSYKCGVRLEYKLIET